MPGAAETSARVVVKAGLPAVDAGTTAVGSLANSTQLEAVAALQGTMSTSSYSYDDSGTVATVAWPVALDSHTKG